MRTKSFLLAAASAALLWSCATGEDQRIVLDNPTEEAITFSIDKDSYTLEAGTSRQIELADGTHTLTYNGNSTSFEKAKEDGGSIVNPTNATYIIWSELYTDKTPNKGYYRTFIKEIEIDGETYQGPFAKVGGIYIRRHDGSSFGVWKWGLDEEMPEDYYTDSMGENFQFKISKIYRVKDFKVAFEKALAGQ